MGESGIEPRRCVECGNELGWLASRVDMWRHEACRQRVMTREERVKLDAERKDARGNPRTWFAAPTVSPPLPAPLGHGSVCQGEAFGCPGTFFYSENGGPYQPVIAPGQVWEVTTPNDAWTGRRFEIVETIPPTDWVVSFDGGKRANVRGQFIREHCKLISTDGLASLQEKEPEKPEGRHEAQVVGDGDCGLKGGVLVAYNQFIKSLGRSQNAEPTPIEVGQVWEVTEANLPETGNRFEVVETDGGGVWRVRWRGGAMAWLADCSIRKCCTLVMDGSATMTDDQIRRVNHAMVQVAALEPPRWAKPDHDNYWKGDARYPAILSWVENLANERPRPVLIPKWIVCWCKEEPLDRMSGGGR